MNIIPGLDYDKIEKERIEKHGDPSRPDYYSKHPNIKRPGGKKRSGPPKMKRRFEGPTLRDLVDSTKKRPGTSTRSKGGPPKMKRRVEGPTLRDLVDSRSGKSGSRPRSKPGSKPGSRPTSKAPNGKLQTGKIRGTGTKEDPIETDDINVAAQALWEGKHVNFTQKRDVSVFLDKLHERVQEVSKKYGKEAVPDIDLCQVTVKGTNLFCIPAVVHRGKDKEGKERGARFFMPQLKAVPIKGSRADKMPKDENGEVDLQPLFREKLMEMGVKIEDGKQKASFLRPSQEYLRADKVAGMVNSLRNFYLNREGRKMSPEGSPIFISSDDYIIDGHHRWAAIVGVDLEDNKEGDIDMDIQRIDMPVSQLLRIANDFADEYGMERQEKALFPNPGLAECGEDIYFVVNSLGRYEGFYSIAKARAEYVRQLDRGHDVYLVKKRRRHKVKGKAGCT